MHTTGVRTAVRAALLGAGLVVLGAASAQADDGATSGADGAAAGNQVVAPVSVPVTVEGVTVSVLGDSVVDSGGAASSGSSGTRQEVPAGPGTTSGEDGVASGNQVVTPVSVPVTVECVDVAVGGDSSTSCEGSGAGTGGATAEPGTTTGEDGAVSGNQASAPVSVPVSVSCVDVAVLGESSMTCDAPPAGGSATAEPGTTSGEDGLVSGNQVSAPVSAPLSASCVGVGVLGDSATSCEGQRAGEGATAGGGTTSGEDGALSGNQVTAPVSLLASVRCVNGGILGDATTTCGHPATSGADGATAQPGSTTGEDGLAAGNQLTVPLVLTAEVGCLGAGALGESSVQCSATQDPPVAGQPGDPVAPGQPGDPGAGPDQPGNPGGEPGARPDEHGTAVAGSRIPALPAAGATHASGVLAMTGAESLPLVPAGLLLLALGGGLLRAGHRPGPARA